MSHAAEASSSFEIYSLLWHFKFCINPTVNELEELQLQLQKEKKQLQKTMQELELVKKDAQQTTLMNMEIADYERLMKELNQKLTNKNSTI